MIRQGAWSYYGGVSAQEGSLHPLHMDADAVGFLAEAAVHLALKAVLQAR